MLRLTRAGRIVASGQAIARRGQAFMVVRLRGGAVRAGQRYTLTATLPAGPRTRRRITHRIVVR